MKTILVAEDHPDDAFLVKMACSRSGIPHQFHHVLDGSVVLEYLEGKERFADRTAFPLPDIIFLDINMPKMSGHETLEWIRGRPHFVNIPVVMLTGSTLKEDIDRAYELGITSYIQKVAGLGQFGQAVRVILKYWLELNLFPIR